RAPGLERLLDLGARPLRLSLPPRVVHVWAGLPDDDVLEPVGPGPSRCRARLEADAPRGRAGVGDLFRERREVVPRLRHGVALGRERLRVVPDRSLEGGLDEDADLLAIDLGELDERVGVLTLHRVHVEDVAEIDELARLRELRHQPRPRKTSKVGRVPALNTRREDGVIARAFVLHLDAGLIFEWLHHREERVLLAPAPGREHAHGPADLTGAPRRRRCARGLARRDDESDRDERHEMASERVAVHVLLLATYGDS